MEYRDKLWVLNFVTASQVDPANCEAVLKFYAGDGFVLSLQLRYKPLYLGWSFQEIESLRRETELQFYLPSGKSLLKQILFFCLSMF